MRLQTTIALAAVATVLAAPVAAEAKARHHAAAKTEEGELSTAEQLHLAQEQLAQMQAQLNALQSKIDQQASANSGSQGQAIAVAQAADAKADQAIAQASAAKAAAAKPAIPDALKWAANTKVGGTVFFDASNIYAQSAGSKSTANGTGFNVKRVYISVDHTFDKTFSANITTDISNVIGETANANYATPTVSNTSGSCTSATACSISSIGLVGKGFYLKKAFVQAKIDPALVIRLGAADMPWVPYVEGLYGHRFVENVLIDEYKYGTSTDWGVHVMGDLAGGLISYQVSAVDGGGYRNVKVTKSVDLEGRLSAQYDGFFGAVGGYTGKLGNAVQGTYTPHTASRFNVAAGYKNADFTLGGEYFVAKDYNSVTTVATEDRALGYSVFGNYNFTPKWSAFGRYDWVKQTNNLTTPQSAYAHYFNMGLQYEPVKIVDLSLVYKREAVDNNTIATQNGTIGGAAGSNGTYDEVGLFGQLKF